MNGYWLLDPWHLKPTVVFINRKQSLLTEYFFAILIYQAIQDN